MGAGGVDAWPLESLDPALGEQKIGYHLALQVPALKQHGVGAEGEESGAGSFHGIAVGDRDAG